MYARREKQKDFRPSASYRALEMPLPRFEKPEEIDPDDDHRVKRPTAVPDFPAMIDAETGESLNYTRAKWTAKEGRLSLTAKTILDMGTGKLDIKNRANRKGGGGTESDDKSDTKSHHSKTNPVVRQFLSEGPLTPMYHVNWNPLKNTVKDPIGIDLLQTNDLPKGNDEASGVRTGPSTIENSSMSSPSAFAKPTAPPKQITAGESTEATASTNHNSTHHSQSAIQQGEKFPLPMDLELMNSRSWETLFAKTFSDLVALTTELERNKFLTKQAPYPGGIAALRRVCKALATLRVNQMREVIQAIDDEADRDQKRETGERAVFDQPHQLHDLRKINREQRKIGKQYIESLQRDHEVNNAFFYHHHMFTRNCFTRQRNL